MLVRVVFFIAFRWIFFFSSRRRHTIFDCDWSSDVCSSDLSARVERISFNERLAGLTLKEIRSTLADRLRDASPSEPGSSELLNIFVQEAEDLFDVPMTPPGTVPVHLGSTQPLAEQPEFSTRARLQGLLEVTERRDLWRDALIARGGEGLTITIGQEHADARLSTFTLVTSRGARRRAPDRS